MDSRPALRVPHARSRVFRSSQDGAPARMLRFVDVAQHMPDKRKAAERRRDFGEIYAEFSAARARPSRRAAARNAACRSASVHCPLSNNIPDWLKLTAEGRLEEAYEVSAATNTPSPRSAGASVRRTRLCEGNCVIEKGFESVTHRRGRALHHRHRMGEGLDQAGPPAASARAVGRHRRCGPGGLAAAEALRRKGYAVHVYDRYDRSAGC